ncbi:MAG: hypothetical protein JWP97_469 [Labilithrix sp.]|nr:hypothetical protein [Labilithrix sp.]
MQPVAAAVVAGPGTIDAMIGDELHEAAAGAATLTRLPDVLPVRGVARELGIDDAWIYVSTSERIVRVRRTPAAPGSNRTTEQLVGDDGPPPPASMYVGDTVLFLATESGVTILGKERDAGSSTIPVKVAAFAAAGDRGFYIADEPSGTSSINEYGSTSAHGRITGKVRALAIAEGYFYVASDKGTRTAISRIAVDAPNDAVPEILVDEPGLVELLRADRGRLYWTASRGAGNRVLASSDLCGGEAADLASELGIAPYHALLFDGDAVYVAGSSTGTILRAPRK